MWRRPRRIFVNAMSDLFHEEVPDEFIDQVFAVMALSPDHTFQVLTKRPQRMRKYLSSGHLPLWKRWGMAAVDMDVDAGLWIPTFRGVDPLPWPLPNVCLGVSVEDQPTANERIPLLLQTPAAVRWVSAEPLLGPVDFKAIVTGCGSSAIGCSCSVDEGACSIHPTLDWIVGGGEFGPGARPMHPEWVRSIRDQCVEAGVAFNFKQWGEWAPNCLCESKQPCRTIERPEGVPGVMFRCGKKAAGRTLDGKIWDEYPGGER